MSRFSQYLSRHRRGLVTLVVVLLVLAALAGAGTLFLRRGRQTAPRETNVTVLRQQDLERIITTRGAVQSTDKQTIYTSLAYKVNAINVKAGDRVAAGEVLAQLDTRDLEQNIADLEKSLKTATSLQNAQVSQAQRSLNNARDQLTIDTKNYQDAVDAAAKNIEALKHEADDTASGKAGPAADAAVAADSRVVDARAVLTAAKNNRDAKQLTVDAMQADLEALTRTDPPAADLTAALAAKYKLSGSPTPSDIATYLTQAIAAARAELAVLDGVYQKAKNEYDAIYDHVRDDIWDDEYKEAYDDVYDTYASAFAAKYDLYDQAVKNLENIQRSNNLTIQARADALTNQKLSDTTISLKSQLTAAKNNLADATITSPVAGTVTDVLATLGMRPSGALFVIQDPKSLELSTTIAEYDIPLIREGQPVQFTTDATGSDILNGIVDRISPAAINTNGDFTVTVRISQPDERLRIGMNAKLTIVLEKRSAVFAVPYDAIITNEAGETVVTALREDGVTRYEVPVTVGMETDYLVEISGPEIRTGLTILNDPQGKNVVDTSRPTGPFGG